MKIAKKEIIRISRLANLYCVNLFNMFQIYDMQNLNFYQEY